MMTFSGSILPSAIRITVRTLRAQREGSEIFVGVLLENGEHREQKNLVVTVEQYYELKLQKGEIDEELYDRLEEASTLCQAMRCGENLLSYGANSIQRLSQKLMRHGYRREVAIAAAQKLCARGLIDEPSDMRREVEKCLRKYWGSRRIHSHLWERGFSAETLEGLSPLLQEVDFIANCVLLIQKHYGTVPQEAGARHKLIAALSRYGYSLSEIQAAIKKCKE